MSKKSTSFDMFRYQILPVNRYMQTDMFHDGVNSIDELIAKKNSFFSKALKETSDFSNNKYKILAQALYNDEKEKFRLLKIAVERPLNVETKDFKDGTVENWPSILIAVWNLPDKQLVAVQRKTSAFSSTKPAIRILSEALEKTLKPYHLRAIFEPMFEKREFWSLIRKHQGKIKSVEFELITPNMANISSSLSDDLKNLAKQANSTKNKLSLESDDSSALCLNENNPTVQGLVEYSSNGGGGISLKVRGIKKKINTKDSVKAFEIDELEIQGPAKKTADIIKDIMKNI